MVSVLVLVENLTGSHTHTSEQIRRKTTVSVSRSNPIQSSAMCSEGQKTSRAANKPLNQSNYLPAADADKQMACFCSSLSSRVERQKFVENSSNLGGGGGSSSWYRAKVVPGAECVTFPLLNKSACRKKGAHLQSKGFVVACICTLKLVASSHER